MANIVIDMVKLEKLFEHATAVAKPPNGDELAYGEEVCQTLYERVIHAYFRKAYLTGQNQAWNEVISKL